jgi:hypothetical protein
VAKASTLEEDQGEAFVRREPCQQREHLVVPEDLHSMGKSEAFQL